MKKFLIFVLIISLCYGCVPAQEKEQVSRELNIYNWEDYFGPTTIEDFEKEFNVKVNLFIFEDETFMESEVQSDPGKYDLVIASGTLIEEMSQLKLLAEIDYSNIPNFKNINSKFKNPSYDLGNKYSVPYLWGTTGIIINTKYIPEGSDSWEILWDSKYSGKMSMLNAKEEVIAAALKYNGNSINEDSESKLEEAKNDLLTQKPLLKGYEDPIMIRDEMISEKLWAAQEYSGDAQFAIGENENLRYIIPKEGALVWTDNFAIPVDAKNKKLAEDFIDFVLRPDVSAKVANYLRYASPNDAAREFTDKELLEDESTYPSPDVEAKLEIFSPSNKAISYYNKVWSELQR